MLTLVVANGYAEEEADQTGTNDNDMNMMETPDEQEITNNPYIMSMTQALGQHSFIEST